MGKLGTARTEAILRGIQVPDRLRYLSRFLLGAPGALLAYEFRIIRSVPGMAVAVLGFITLILILGSPHQGETTIVFFEDLVSLALLVTTSHLLAMDQDHGTLELVFISVISPFRLYLRRFLAVLGINTAVITSLTLVWHLWYLPLPIPHLLWVALPPMIFMMSISFDLSLVTNNANIGAMLAGGYWILHQLLRKYGDHGWFGYLFLFKATYYPGSATFLANRLVLLLLAGGLLAVSSAAFRTVERYL